MKNESKNVWQFVTLLMELAVPLLLVVWSTEKLGSVKIALILVASVLGANVLIKLYFLTRK